MDRQTHRQTHRYTDGRGHWPIYISPWLCLTRNVIISSKALVHPLPCTLITCLHFPGQLLVVRCMCMSVYVCLMMKITLELNDSVSIITSHRNTTYVNAAYCYRPNSVVCRSVGLPACLCVCHSEPCIKRLNRSRRSLGCGIGWA